MTLVVRSIVNGLPILLGDILITGRAMPGLECPVPTIRWGDPMGQRIIADGRGPVGLLQKIVVCNDRLIIGWAGDVDAAHQVVTRIRDKALESGFADWPSLQRFLQSLPSPLLDKIALTGFLRTGDEFTSFGDGDGFFEIPSTRFPRLAILGTGIKDFIAVRDLLEAGTIGVSEGFVGCEDHPQVMGTGMALSMVSSLFRAETIESLQRWFGGGYEIATIIDNKFSKIGDMTFMFWRVSVADGRAQMPNAPVAGVRYGYEDDVLLIRTLEPDYPNNHILTVKRAVAPVYWTRAPDAETFPTLPFNATHLVNCIDFKKSNGETLRVFMSHTQRPGEWIVDFREENGKTEIAGVDKMYRALIAATEEALREFLS